MFLIFIRYLLFPFSLLYAGISRLRNLGYDKKIFKSESFSYPIICVGNLHLGGTGKTPMIDFLLTGIYTKKAVLIGRGYQRTNKAKVLPIDTEKIIASACGDELFLLKQKHPNLAVIAANERIQAIRYAEKTYPSRTIFLLDDALQHRKIKPSFSILLSTYQRLYTNDFLIPTGNLRDNRTSAKRADIIIITKCPSLDEKTRQKIHRKIKPLPHQKVFFTQLQYGTMYPIFEKETAIDTNALENIITLQGVASPKYLTAHLQEKYTILAQFIFKDHHRYSLSDIASILTEYKQLKSKNPVFITTEKDAVKLLPFSDKLSHIPFLAIPVEHKFLFNETPDFRQTIHEHVSKFKL